MYLLIASDEGCLLHSSYRHRPRLRKVIAAGQAVASAGAVPDIGFCRSLNVITELSRGWAMRRSIGNFSPSFTLSTTTAHAALVVSKYMLTTMFARPRAGIPVSLRPLHTTARIGYPRSPPPSSCPLTKGGSSSSSSSSDQKSTEKQKRHKWGERLGVLFAVGVVVYIADRELNASALTRSLRTGYIG